MKYEGGTHLTQFGIHKLLLQSTLGIVRTIRNLSGIFLHLKNKMSFPALELYRDIASVAPFH